MSKAPRASLKLIVCTENIALNGGASLDKIPEECLSPTEKYENAIRKSVLYSKIVKDELLEFTGLEALG